jgi:diacylglycerol kinase family enzyme
MRVWIVDNPWSFRGAYPVVRILPTLAAAGWRVDVDHRRPDLSTRRVVEAATAAGCRLIVSGGGDGTLRDLAASLRGHDIALGALAGGTANVFARELQIPAEPEAAARTLIEAVERPIDLGRFGLDDGRSTRFVLAAGVGLDAAVLAATDPRLKRRIGPLAMLAAGLPLLPRYRPFEAAITVDDVDAWSGSCLQVIVGNTRCYATVLEPNPSARLDDAALDALVIPALGARDLTMLVAHVARTGRPHPDLTMSLRGSEIRLATTPAAPVELDGSPLGRWWEGPRTRPPAEATYLFTAEPAAVRFRVPRHYAGPLFGPPQTDRAGP